MTNISKQLHRVDVFPEINGRQNVVGRVYWAVVFERNGVSSAGGVETLLDVSNLDAFTPVEQITKEQVLEWAFQEQGGDQFVAQIQPFHEERLDWEERCKGLTPYHGIPNDLPVLNAPATVPSSVL